MKVPGTFITEILGYNNIEHDFEAVYELIKNSIDAGANNITLNFEYVEQDILIIEDDGEGLDESELKDAWETLESSKKEDTSLGGKGIGRFTTFKLGNTIESFSKKKSKENKIVLKREEIEKIEDIAKYNFNIETSKGELSGDQGTKIIIKDLNISKKSIIGIMEKLQLIHIPFTEPNYKLEIKLPEDLRGNYVNDSKLSYGFLKPCEAIKYSPFKFEIEFKEGEVVGMDFKYSSSISCDFQEVMTADEKEQFIKKVNKNIEKHVGNLSETRDVSYEELKNFGTIDLELYSFWMDNNNNFLDKQNMKHVKEKFLSIYQGINIYRNNMMISGFGENDWLKLAESRVARSSDNIDNKLTFGYIKLESFTKNDILVERTNRYGFSSPNNEELLRIIIFDNIKLFANDIRKKYIKKLKEDIENLKKKEDLKSEKITIEENSKNDDTKQNDKNLQNILEKLNSYYSMVYGDDFNLENELKKEIGNEKCNDLKIKYPPKLNITSNGYISGKNEVGKYSNILVEYKENTKNITLYVNKKGNGIILKSNTRESEINILNKLYRTNFPEYPKFCYYLEFIKENLNDEKLNPILPLVVQSFLEMNFKLFLQQLDGVSQNKIDEKNQSGHIIQFNKDREYDINNYKSLVLNLLCDNNKSGKIQDFYISLNKYKHNLDEPLPDHILNKYFDYCHETIKLLVNKIIENKI